jgi:hypothetical protein
MVRWETFGIAGLVFALRRSSPGRDDFLPALLVVSYRLRRVGRRDVNVVRDESAHDRRLVDGLLPAMSEIVPKEAAESERCITDYSRGRRGALTVLFRLLLCRLGQSNTSAISGINVIECQADRTGVAIATC